MSCLLLTKKHEGLLAKCLGGSRITSIEPRNHGLERRDFSQQVDRRLGRLCLSNILCMSFLPHMCLCPCSPGRAQPVFHDPRGSHPEKRLGVFQPAPDALAGDVLDQISRPEPVLSKQCMADGLVGEMMRGVPATGSEVQDRDLCRRGLFQLGM
jgi:hypothetical protein